MSNLFDQVPSSSGPQPLSVAPEEPGLAAPGYEPGLSQPAALQTPEYQLADAPKTTSPLEGNPFSWSSFALSLVGVFMNGAGMGYGGVLQLLAPVVGIAAVILGIIGIRRARLTNGGRGPAIIGICIGALISLSIFLLFS